MKSSAFINLYFLFISFASAPHSNFIDLKLWTQIYTSNDIVVASLLIFKATQYNFVGNHVLINHSICKHIVFF